MNIKDEAIWAADQLHTLSAEFTAEDAARIFPINNNAPLQELINHLV